MSSLPKDKKEAVMQWLAIQFTALDNEVASWATQNANPPLTELRDHVDRRKQLAELSRFYSQL